MILDADVAINSSNIDRILWQFNLYDSQRAKLVKNLGKYKLFLPLKADIIIAKSDIYTFPKDCNLNV